MEKKDQNEPGISYCPQEARILFLFLFLSIRGSGEEMATHFSILAWVITRGTWWATVHGVTTVGHDLASKSPPSVIAEEYYSKKIGNGLKPNNGCRCSSSLT